MKQKVKRQSLWAAAAVSTVVVMPLLGGASATSAPIPDTTFTVEVDPQNPRTELTRDTFRQPRTADRPWVRWNFPPETASTDQLIAELEDMEEVGIAGVEIGQGGEPTMEQLEAILTGAAELGIEVSLKAGDGGPTAYPADDDYVRKTLSARQAVVASGQRFQGELPGEGTIVAVLAYRCADQPCGTGKEVELERDSMIELTDTLTGTDTAGFSGGTTTGTLDWTAPEGRTDSEWIVLTVRSVTYASMPEIMSTEGTQQLIDGYEEYWTPEVKRLLTEHGGDVFVDSHATDPWGLPQELWSSNLAEDFQDRFGYDLIPELAVLFDATNSNPRSGSLDTPHFYSFDDGSTDRVRSDHTQLRTELFIENRIEPFDEWLSGYNLALRLQPEDAPPTSAVDQIQVAAALDRPEHESLAAGDQVDVFRPIASANHMTGNDWYSTECCAARFMSYAQTYQDAIVRMNKEYAGGVTKLVYHVYSHREGANQTWPGYHNFGKAGFSNAWNGSEPYWVHARQMNDYFARNQMVLTQGDPRMDVAVYMKNFSFPQPWGEESANGWGLDDHRFWKDLGLQRAGYTWDYLNPTLLDLPNAVVADGILAPDGPGYRAFVYDGTQTPATNTARGDLDLASARKILTFAQQGLPVLFVGKLPTQVPGNAPQDDATLQDIVKEILAEPTTWRVRDQAAVPAKLAREGVRPAVAPAKPSNLLSVRREDAAAGTNYYFLYNQGVDQVQPTSGRQTYDGTPENIFEEPAACRREGANPCTQTGHALRQKVTLEGRGRPYLLDTTTGDIKPIARYQRQGNKVSLRVELATDESTVIALAPPNRFRGATSKTAVVRTLADDVVQDGRRTLVRAGKPGTYRTVLDTGKVLRAKVGKVPGARDLTDARWTLQAEDWRPARPYGTTGPAGAETTKERVRVELDGLRAWPDIPELANASGVGTYTTTVRLPKRWNRSYGAILQLGQVVDTVSITVNGHPVAVNQLSTTADIGPRLRSGRNTIEVKVATTLNNRLASLDPAVEARGLIQEYGLSGPVVLQPYRQVVVARR